MNGNSASKVFLLCGGIFALCGSVSLTVTVFILKNMDMLRQNGQGDVEILPFIFGLTGTVALGVSIAIFAVFYKKASVRKRLLEAGYSVTANITGFPADYSVRVNRMPTYRMECSYQDPSTGVVHIFRSEPLVYNPAPYVTQRTVCVYVERNSGYKTYYVDADSVLPETQRH